MRCIHAIAVICLAATSAFAQHHPCSYDYMHLSGTIAGERMIADLVVSGPTIRGSGIYYGSGCHASLPAGEPCMLRLEGRVDAQGVAGLRAFQQDLEWGELSGLWGNPFRGTFREVAGGKTHTFMLEEDYGRGSIPLTGYCLVQDSALSDSLPSPKASLRLELLLPEGDEDTALLRQAIISNIFGSPLAGLPGDDLLQGYANDYFAAYIRANADLLSEGHSFDWQKSIGCGTEMNHNGILVYRSDSYGYSGGAHGLGKTQFLVFDTEKMHPVDLSALLIPEYEAALSELLEAEFRAQHFLEPGQDLRDAGLFENSIPPSPNFYVTPREMVFFYNPYELAPYAMGASIIRLTFDQMEGLLNGSPLIGRLTKK